MSTWFPAVKVAALRGGPVLRWGVMAPGEIAGDFTATVLANTDQQITAVASRSHERAAAFAQHHHIPKAYGSYDQLAADPDIDIVYVASPHAQHKRLALLAINAGKHVLVEKPLGLNAAEAGEIAAAAAAAGVFVAEAMWSRYLPQFDVLHQVLVRGDIGTIRLATADVGWKVPRDPSSRFLDPELGGGAALDMGVYGYWFAEFAIGPPSAIAALGSIGDTGVDEQAVVALAGSGNRHASVTTSMLFTNSGLAAIHGTDGTARFRDSFVFPARFAVTVGGDTHEWQDTSNLKLREGLAWQATAIAGYIAEGRTDSPVHSLDVATSVLRTIDTVRTQLAQKQQ
jgi:predicted dehydrogenase